MKIILRNHANDRLCDLCVWRNTAANLSRFAAVLSDRDTRIGICSDCLLKLERHELAKIKELTEL